MVRSTRKFRGGFNTTNTARIRARYAGLDETAKKQVQHCVSQLRRFCNCFMKGDMKRLLQFGYNLGRLQELCGETEKHLVWWKPIDKAVGAGEWQQLSDYIDLIKTTIGIEYDETTVNGGC